MWPRSGLKILKKRKLQNSAFLPRNRESGLYEKTKQDLKNKIFCNIQIAIVTFRNIFLNRKRTKKLTENMQHPVFFTEHVSRDQENGLYARCK